MKLNEVIQVSNLSEEQLNEITAKQIIAAGAIALAAFGINKRMQDKADYEHERIAAQSQKQTAPKVDQTRLKEFKRLEKELNNMAKVIANKYQKDPEEAKAFAALAKKYEKPDFPKAKDLLALMGTESSFNPNAVSALKKDPAVGILQIRPLMWGLDPSALRKSVDLQVSTAADILQKYHAKLGDKDSAIKAYNIGITNFKKGKQLDAAERYHTKYRNEVSQYSNI